MPSAAESKTLKNSHGGFHGPTLIQRIEKQMDKRRKVMEDIFVQGKAGGKDYFINRGRYEGFAATLAILRTSSVKHEIERSNERLGIN